MLELGQANEPNAAAAELIRDGNEQTFMQDVVEASKEVPVVVDFWAPWCGPCKTLGPALEAAVGAAGGKVRMVKINVDENPGISSQLRIQSIPTVYAFWQGQPVDGFQGAVPGSEVNAFIDRLTKLGPDGGVGEALEAAETLLSEGAVVEAAQMFASVLTEDRDNAEAFGGMVRAHLALGDLDQAEAILNGAPAEISESAPIEAARAALEIARQGQKAGPVDELKAKVEASPDDLQARFDLAIALHAHGDVAGAVDELLEVFRRDREWNDGAAKAQLFTIFEALKPQDPIALNGRRKLSSMIFA